MSAAFQAPALIDLLRDQPHRFDLFRAVQLLERQLPAANEDGDRDGGLPVRFVANPSLSFPAHEIQRLALPAPVEEDEEAGLVPSSPARADIALNLMTLTGPLPALPQVYTETVIRSLKDRTPGFAAFLDLFNDRIGALFFEAWRRYRLPALYEKHGLSGGDAATTALFSVAGFGTDHLRDHCAVRDEVMVYFAGLFSQQPRAAVSLERMLAEACGIPVQVRQFQGRWIKIPATEQTSLRSGGRNAGYNRLGVDTVAGARMWDVQGYFRLVLGPLTRRQFQDHLPGGAGLRRVVELARLYVGSELEFDVQLILRREDVPDCVLNEKPGKGVRLGYDGWLAAFPMVRDPDDTVIEISSLDF